MGGDVELGKQTLEELQRLKDMFKEAESHGVDLTAHKAVFRTAVTALKDKQYEDAWAQVDKARGGIEKTLALACMTRVQVGRRVLERLKSQGKESPEALDVFKSLEPLMREKDFIGVLKRSHELEKAIGNVAGAPVSLVEDEEAPAPEKEPAAPTPEKEPATPAPEVRSSAPIAESDPAAQPPGAAPTAPPPETPVQASGQGAAMDAGEATAPPKEDEGEKAKRLLGIFRQHIDRDAAIGVDMGPLEDQYREIEGNLALGEYETCMDQIQKAQGDMEFARRNFIVESLTYCYDLIQVAPDYIDLSGPKDMYSEAMGIYGEGNVDEALKTAGEMRSAVDDLKEEHERLLGMITGCEKDVEMAAGRGIDTGDAAEVVASAKSSMLAGDFPTAFASARAARAIIDKANEAAYHTFREKAWTTWLGAQNMLASAVEDGVEVDGGEQLLQKAREAFDLATSIDMFNDVYEHIDTLQRKEAEGREEKREEREALEGVRSEVERLEAEAGRVRGHIVLSALDSDLSLLADARERKNLDEMRALVEKSTATLDEALLISPEIFLEIAGEGLRPDVWSQISLVVSNVGKANARNIRMNFDGPLEVRRVKTIDGLRAGEKKVMEVGVKFSGVGKVPIDVEIIYGRTLDEKQYLFSEETWLEVGDAATGGARRVTRIGSSYECSFCKQVIEGDDGVVKCSCNLAYHEHCARKSGSCPSCQENISHKPPIIRSQKVHHFEGAPEGAAAGVGGVAASGAGGGAEGPAAVISDEDGTWLD